MGNLQRTLSARFIHTTPIRNHSREALEHNTIPNEYYEEIISTIKKIPPEKGNPGKMRTESEERNQVTQRRSHT
jgi:hypothetical protein